MNKLTLVVLSTLALLLVGCSPRHIVATHEHEHTQPTVHHGLQRLLSVAELKGLSDLVVKGSPTGRKPIQKLYADSPGYPADLAALRPDEVHNMEEVSFRVDEYYKGTGPQTISVMMDAGYHDLRVGTDYVLFLDSLDTAAGRAYWNDGYLIQGPQGLWAVSGDTATREMGEVKSLTLTEFRDIRAVTPTPVTTDTTP